MKFKINCIPPSFNRLYLINYNLRKVYMCKEALEFKKKVGLFTPKLEHDKNDLFRLTVWVNTNWICKNGNIKVKDVRNMEKALTDAMCKKLGFDDCRIWRSELIKIQNEEKEFIEIELIPYSITDNATLFK